jgi:flagellar biosynthetic protein FlhB
VPEQEKTERPTARRMEKAREHGQVAQTRELGSALVLAAALLFFSFAAAWFADHLFALVRTPFGWIGQVELTPPAVWRAAAELGFGALATLAPLMGMVLVAGVAADVGQVGLMTAPEAIGFKLERIDPVAGVGRLFSWRAMVEALKSLIKITVIGWLLYSTVMGLSEQLLDLENQEPAAIVAFLMTLIRTLLWRVTIVMFFLGILDYAFQRYEWERQLRMTRQEVLEEFKEMEGDPKIKARIRSIQREVAMRRMMQEAPKADVVITNPTEYAVALRYQADLDKAPRVIAKGKGHVAARIREVAAQAGVPVLERPELARAIHKLVKLGEFIPASLYQAAAEILAYVYRLKEQRRASNG